MAQGALRALTDTARVVYADTKANEYAKQNAANSIGSSYCGTKTKSDSATTLGKKTVNIYTTTLANNDKYKNTLNYQAGYFGMSVAMIAGSAALEGAAQAGETITTKSGYKLTNHAVEQLGEARFNGKLSIERLDELMNSQNAIKVIDNRSGNVNMYVESEFSASSLMRITTPSDGGQRVISIGFEPLKRINKFIDSGDFTVIK